MPAFTLDEINAMDEEAFSATLGSIFEHSPWVARRTWPSRPFTSVDDLHGKMCRILLDSTPEEQFGVIIAHPDLGERMAALTPESTGEQAAAGLDTLTPEELSLFQENNTAYKARFGFPFIICARLNDKSKMLASFSARLKNERGEELKTAIGQIELIALLRLKSLIP